jgi:hypothetical protein
MIAIERQGEEAGEPAGEENNFIVDLDLPIRIGSKV